MSLDLAIHSSRQYGILSMQELCRITKSGPKRDAVNKGVIKSAHNGTSSIICVAPSLPTVMITSPSVLVEKPASEYLK